MRFESKRQRQYRQATERPFPAEWRRILAMSWAGWHSLTLDERSRLEPMIQEFVASKRWEAAQGFQLVEEMIVLIAAQACLLVLELPADYYRGVGTIIVHPTTMVIDGPRVTDNSGVFQSGPFPIQGQAQYEGPVVVAWDAVRREARYPEYGNNVVFHEFAHKLDMLDGTVDGMPPLPDSASRKQWIDVCTREYEALKDETSGPLIREYGAVNPGEFFAVVSEIFFCRPVEMRAEKPELYAVLAGFYRQNPALRVAGE